MSAPGAHHIDTGRWFRQELLLGALVPTALGVSGVVAAVGDFVEGGTATRVVVGLLGLVFLGVGGGLYFWLFARTPRTWLDIDDDGLAQRTPRGVTWRVDWAQVTDLDVARTRLSITSYDTVQRRRQVQMPRWWLTARVTPDAARLLAAHLDDPRGEPRRLAVDLGVPGRTAREVRAALGTRLDSKERHR